MNNIPIPPNPRGMTRIALRGDTPYTPSGWIRYLIRRATQQSEAAKRKHQDDIAKDFDTMRKKLESLKGQ